MPSVKPSINLRQLRDTRKLKSWLKAGKTIELRERNTVLGDIVPRNGKQPSRHVEWPDFEAQAREIFGNQVLPGADLLIEERERSRY
jgi:hypothetical protein